jgi:hypothetical protein
VIEKKERKEKEKKKKKKITRDVTGNSRDFIFFSDDDDSKDSGQPRKSSRPWKPSSQALENIADGSEVTPRTVGPSGAHGVEDPEENGEAMLLGISVERHWSLSKLSTLFSSLWGSLLLQHYERPRFPLGGTLTRQQRRWNSKAGTWEHTERKVGV